MFATEELRTTRCTRRRSRTTTFPSRRDCGHNCPMSPEQARGKDGRQANRHLGVRLPRCIRCYRPPGVCWRDGLGHGGGDPRARTRLSVLPADAAGYPAIDPTLSREGRSGVCEISATRDSRSRTHLIRRALMVRRRPVARYDSSGGLRPQVWVCWPSPSPPRSCGSCSDQSISGGIPSWARRSRG